MEGKSNVIVFPFLLLVRDLQLVIVSFVGLEEKKKLRLVSKQFKQLIENHFIIFHLRVKKQQVEQFPQIVQQFPTLSKLSFSSNSWSCSQFRIESDSHPFKGKQNNFLKKNSKRK